VRDVHPGLVFACGRDAARPLPAGADEARLFDGHGLGEVARLVYIGALKDRDVVGEQL
jgi:hypothetical protein